MGFAENGIVDGLNAAAAETLENLAFTELARRAINRIDGSPSDFKGARISLGTLGDLDLILGRELLGEIAVLLFNPPGGEADPEMLDDTLNEILNIIAGRFLHRIFQGESDFALGLPETHLDVEEWNSHPLRTILVTEAGMELAVALRPPANG